MTICNFDDLINSRIKSKPYVETRRFTDYLRKLFPERISDIRMGFVIRYKFGIPITYKSQKGLTKNAHPGGLYELRSIQSNIYEI